MELPPSLLSSLPQELTHHVFSYLNPLELLQAGRVCRNWQSLAADDVLWRRFIRRPRINPLSCRDWVVTKLRDYCFRDIFPLNNYIYTACEKKFRVLHQKERTPAIYSFKQKAVKYSISAICSFQYFSRRDIALKKNYFLTGGSDGIIRFWSITETEQYKFLISQIGNLTPHQKPIKYLKIRNNHLFSYSTDGILKIWKISIENVGSMTFFKCLHVSDHAKQKINCFLPFNVDHVNARYFFGVGKTIQVWTLFYSFQEKCEQVLTGHDSPVTELASANVPAFSLFSGSLDGIVKIWHLMGNKLECLQSIAAHTAGITTLLSHPFQQMLVSGSLNGTIGIWSKNGNKWELDKQISLHNSRILSIKFGPISGTHWPQKLFVLFADNTLHILERDRESLEFGCATTIPGKLMNC